MKIEASEKIDGCTVELDKSEFDWLESFLAESKAKPELFAQSISSENTVGQIQHRFLSLLQAMELVREQTKPVLVSISVADLFFLIEVLEELQEDVDALSMLLEELRVDIEAYSKEFSSEFARFVMKREKKSERTPRPIYKPTVQPEDPNAVSLQVVPYMEEELGCGEPRPPLEADGSYKYYRAGKYRPIRITMTKDNLVSCVEGPFCEKAEEVPSDVRVVFECDGALMRELRDGRKLVPISKEDFLDLYENYSNRSWVNLSPEANGNYEYYCFAGFRPIRTSKTKSGTEYAAEAPSYENGGKLRFNSNLSRILWKGNELEPISKEEFIKMCRNYMGYMTIGKGIKNMLRENKSHILPQEAGGNFKYYCLAGQHPIKVIYDKKWNVIGVEATSYKDAEKSWLTQLSGDIKKGEEITPISEEKFVEMCAKSAQRHI